MYWVDYVWMQIERVGCIFLLNFEVLKIVKFLISANICLFYIDVEVRFEYEFNGCLVLPMMFFCSYMEACARFYPIYTVKSWIYFRLLKRHAHAVNQEYKHYVLCTWRLKKREISYNIVQSVANYTWYVQFLFRKILVISLIVIVKIWIWDSYLLIFFSFWFRCYLSVSSPRFRLHMNFLNISFVVF